MTNGTSVARATIRQTPGARALALVLAALALVAGTLTFSAGRPAGAQPEQVLPPSKVTAEYGLKGQLGDVALPSCNSINIDGRGGMGAKWTVTSSLGTNSVIHPGRTWTVRIQMHTNAGYLNTANDGPMPLRIRAVPQGPVAPAADPVVGTMSHYAHLGNGEVGPIGGPAQWGPWGADYDQDSDPILFIGSDGNSVDITLTLRATGPGYVTLPQLSVSGYDETPKAGPVSCSMPIAWVWQVVAPPGPVAGADVAATDARYTDVVPGDAQSGAHTVLIDVLADDDDPNVPGGPGDLSQVRIASWPDQSAAGGFVDCGPEDERGLPMGTPLTELSAGPCRYRPPFDHEGPDSFTYTVRSATGESTGTVTVNVAPNLRPTMSPSVFGTTINTDEVFDLAPSIVDPDGDPVTCQAIGPPAPAAGSIDVAPDCTLTWDNTSPGFTGNVTQLVRACDTSPTLQPPALGQGVVRDAAYHNPGDLDPAHGRRCTESTATIGVLAGLVLPPTGVSDVDVVDAGYPDDAIGGYTVRVPVLANDTDGNGPAPALPAAALGLVEGPDGAEGTAWVDGDEIVFTPAPGHTGPVAMTYRVCEDPLAQDPPYLDDPDTPLIDEGLPVCGLGNLTLHVVGNAAPVTGPDEAVVAHDAAIDELDVGANDADPDGDGTSCTPGSPTTSQPALVAAVSIDADCTLDLTPVEGADGSVEVTYEVCDDHVLSTPAHPAVPYGADGRSPGEPAPRCADGTATVTIVGPVPEVEEPVDPAPVCASDTAETATGQSVTVDVLANDSDLDVEGQPAEVVLTGPPADEPGTGTAGGQAAMTDDGVALEYTPPPGFVGTDQVLYTARDGAGQGCKATVEVTVTAAPAEPAGPTAPPGGNQPAEGAEAGGAGAGATTTTGTASTPSNASAATERRAVSASAPTGGGAPAADGGAGDPPTTGSLPVTGAATTLVLVGAAVALLSCGAVLRALAARAPRR